MSKKNPNPPSSSNIVNFYEKMPKKMLVKAFNPNYQDHHIKLPMRMVVCAPSGSGKTNYILNLIALFSRGQGTFETIHICTRNKREPLYDYLTQEAKGITISEGFSTLPNLDDFDYKVNHLVIVDDLVLSKNQERICDYYIRCRKLGCSVVYLSQSYFLCPKLIRDNCNYMVLLKLSGQRQVNLILSEFSLGVTKEQLLAVYREATKTKLDPLMIDMEAEPEERFRRGFGELLDPSDFI